MSTRHPFKRTRRLPELPPLCVATLGGFWIAAYRRECLKLQALDDLTDLRNQDEPLYFAISDAEWMVRTNIGTAVEAIKRAGLLLCLRQKGGAA